MEKKNSPVIVEKVVGEVVKEKAMIIDDAFDKDLTGSPVRHAYFVDFYNENNQGGALDDLFATHGINLPDLNEVNDDSNDYKKLIENLWTLRNDQEEAREQLNPLFHVKLSKIEDLESIVENLKEYQFDIITKNSNADDFSEVKDGDVRIILIDYNLGEDGEEAVANARAKAHKIYNDCPKDKKPLMVLMSSYATVKDKLGGFKVDSSLGDDVVLRFAAKENLMNKLTASLLVEIFKNQSEQIHKLQRYILSLKKAAGKALKTFQNDVGVLSIDDYAFIQHSTLDGQSHPLGDYLGWLYGSHWANLLQADTDLHKEKTELDSLMVSQPVQYYGTPCTKMVEIYMSALFETGIGDIPDYHSWSGKPRVDKDTPVIASLPHLHLGDILIAPNSKELLMVLNPQCDLERPTDSMKKNAVLMIAGELYDMDFKVSPQGQPGQRTELIIHENKQYRIIWKPKLVQTVELGKFNQWKKENNLERKYRLRLHYALEVQHAFTATVSRVGLPVSPPFAMQLSINVYIRNLEGGFELLLPEKNSYGFVAALRVADKKVRLTLDFALDLKRSVSEYWNKLKEEGQLEQTGDGAGKVDKEKAKHLKKFDLFSEKFDKWFLESANYQYVDTVGTILEKLVLSSVDYNDSVKVGEGLILVNVVSGRAVKQEPQGELKVAVTTVDNN